MVKKPDLSLNLVNSSEILVKVGRGEFKNTVPLFSISALFV